MSAPAIGYENTRLSKSPSSSEVYQNFVDREGNKFDILRFSAAFSYDTRNRAILPTRGVLHRVSSEMAVPSFGDSIEFFKVGYRTQWYYPVLRDFIFTVKGELGYGDGLFETNKLPFFENFYAGGPRSVRGYEENTWVPRNASIRWGQPRTEDEPLAASKCPDRVVRRGPGRSVGNIKLIGGAEMIFPLPFPPGFQTGSFAAFLTRATSMPVMNPSISARSGIPPA